MSYSFSRDRTEELRNSFEGRENSDSFGPARVPAGYRRTSAQPIVTRRDQDDNNPFVHNNGRPPPTPRHNDAYEMQQPSRAPPDLDTMDGFLSEIDALKREIALVNDKVNAIERVHNSALVSYNDEQWRQLSAELERLQSDTRKQNAEIKRRLTAIERSTARQPNISDVQIRKTQSAAVRQRFLDTIRRYQDIENDYRQKYRQKVARQIRIVKEEATEEEIDEIIDSDQATQLFSQSILQAGRQAQARAVLSEVQSRHDDIKRIEKTLLELHQLFEDMSMLVTQQGEVLVQIEQDAEATAGHLKEGNRFVDRAIKSARSTRAKKWCCFVLIIILCVVIAILVWWFGFNHVGVGNNSNK